MVPLLAADFSQLEYRIAAHIWNDPKFVAAVRLGDAHHAVAVEMFGAAANDPESKKEIRVLAKNVNFGTLFGSEGYAVSKQTGLPLEKVQAFIESWREAFPGAVECMNRTKQQAINPGFITSITGRRRRFFLPVGKGWERNSQYKHELREALNFPVQGPAAEITFLAQVLVEKWLTREGLRGNVVNTIHDCLLLDYPKDEEERIKGGVQQIMENLPTKAVWGFELVVPLSVVIKVGPDWGALG